MAWPSSKAVTFSNGGACTPANLNSIQDQFLRAGGILLSDLDTNLQIPPVGAVLPFAGVAAPDSNWMLCDGAAISRATYAALFAVLGTNYGTGDGSTTFNIPDTRGRVMVGKGVQAAFDTLGESGGAETITLAEAEIPSHTHTGSTGTQTANHNHYLNYMFGSYTSGGIALSVFLNQTASLGTTGTENVGHTHAFSSDNAGSGGAHENMMPFIVHNHIIRVQ